VTAKKITNQPSRKNGQSPNMYAFLTKHVKPNIQYPILTGRIQHLVPIITNFLSPPHYCVTSLSGLLIMAYNTSRSSPSLESDKTNCSPVVQQISLTCLTCSRSLHWTEFQSQSSESFNKALTLGKGLNCDRCRETRKAKRTRSRANSTMLIEET